GLQGDGCRRWRGEPRRVGEVEELAHVRLGGVALSESRQVKTFFGEAEDRSQVRGRVRDGTPLCKRWNDEERYPEPVAGEVAGDVRGGEIDGLDAVRMHCVERRRNVVEHATAFIKGEEERRVFPRRAFHERLQERSDIGGADLDVRTGVGLAVD